MNNSNKLNEKLVDIAFSSICISSKPFFLLLQERSSLQEFVTKEFSGLKSSDVANVRVYNDWFSLEKR